jgi:photosystem II stability/assembly factor-like uncharacterized protein
MKAVISFLFLIFLISSCKKKSNIEEKITSTFCLDTTSLQSNFSGALSSVFFLNGKDGFVADYNGGIYKTSDSAKHWAPLNSIVSLPIYSLFFIDELKGFAVGGQNSCGGTGCVPPGGFILRTLDGGLTWTKVYTPIDKIEISSVYFVNASIGFCAGDNVILRTSDGGQTWSEYKVNNLGGKMMQVKFVDTQKGYIVCLSDKIIKTEDGGSTWQVTSPQRNLGYYSISEAKGSTYVSGQGKIIKSINGGSSWNELPNSPTNIYAIHFINDKKGFAFGSGNYSGGDFGHTYGSIFCTNDGGNTWNGSKDVKVFGPILSVSFPTNNIGYAVSLFKVMRLTVK